MKVNTSYSKNLEIKRNLYLVIFPLLFIIYITYWLFSPNVNHFMELALPVLCILIVIISFLIYFNFHMRICEITSLVAFSIYHLFRIYYLPFQFEDGSMNVYALWSPIFLTYIFIVLERKWALYYAIMIFFITIVMGVPHFYNSITADFLIQYYISTVLYIFILFYFKKIISNFIESEILKKYAYYDYLTDIGNRRLLDKWLENEIKRCHKTNHVFSIIYFDIDHFKKVNDKYGHDIGDNVLKEFSFLVKSCISSNDYFGRWGGEEFILILPNQSLTEATQFADNLRQIIEKHSFQYVGQVTSSFGISAFQQNDLSKNIIKRADEALYIAKNNGRNVVATKM